MTGSNTWHTPLQCIRVSVCVYLNVSEQDKQNTLLYLTWATIIGCLFHILFQKIFSLSLFIPPSFKMGKEAICRLVVWCPPTILFHFFGTTLTFGVLFYSPTTKCQYRCIEVLVLVFGTTATIIFTTTTTTSTNISPVHQMLMAFCIETISGVFWGCARRTFSFFFTSVPTLGFGCVTPNKSETVDHLISLCQSYIAQTNINTIGQRWYMNNTDINRIMVNKSSIFLVEIFFFIEQIKTNVVCWILWVKRSGANTT